jgi:hypothetical protein
MCGFLTNVKLTYLVITNFTGLIILFVTVVIPLWRARNYFVVSFKGQNLHVFTFVKDVFGE